MDIHKDWVMLIKLWTVCCLMVLIILDYKLSYYRRKPS
jgi:hypothetical protein